VRLELGNALGRAKRSPFAVDGEGSALKIFWQDG
jgi:hypothetical protein